MSRLFALVLLPLLLVANGAAAATPEPCSGYPRETLLLDGQQASGVYYLPPSTPVTRLVVVAHGRGHSAESWCAHLAKLSQHTGALAVVVDYPLDFDGNARGAAEVIALTRHFRSQHPLIQDTYLLAVSMGNVVASLVLTQAPGLFDWWIDIEGVSDLFETWLEARVAAEGRQVPAFGDGPAEAGRAAERIEEGCGGRPTDSKEAFACYQQRSAALQVAAIRGGVRGAIVVHAYEDGVVPYNQSRELVANLDAHQVPVTFYSVLGRDCRLNHEGNTTLSGYAGQNPACLAGHASEHLTHPVHVVMDTGFRALYALVAGTHVPQGTTECVVDRPAPPPQDGGPVSASTSLCAGWAIPLNRGGEAGVN